MAAELRPEESESGVDGSCLGVGETALWVCVGHEVQPLGQDLSLAPFHWALFPSLLVGHRETKVITWPRPSAMFLLWS